LLLLAFSPINIDDFIQRRGSQKSPVGALFHACDKVLVICINESGLTKNQ
jgi:hypothetical protein